MPALMSDPPLSVLSNSASSSSDAPTRKSHDKTIAGVFAYTNGTDVETGLPDHRLEQLKTARSASPTASANGTINGSLKGIRDRSHSNAGSTNSMSSRNARSQDYFTRLSMSSDGLTKLSTVKNVSDEPTTNGQLLESSVLTESPSHKSTLQDGFFEDATTSVTTEPRRSGPPDVSPSPARQHPPLNRFSSSSAMSPGASYQDRHSEAITNPELPRLTQRHTLQVPRAAGAASRSSRDFSFNTGPTEEAFTTGRFSPTRDREGSITRHRRASLGLVRRTTRSMASDAYLDEVPVDEDAARWTELIKQKRASRRRRREEEDDDRVIVGKKVEEGHVNWVTAYNMLTGIRFTVSRTNAKIDRELTDVDFNARHKFSFDVTGNELTPSAKYDFKFKDYSPWVFRHLRSIFGLDPADYLMSLTSKYILSELGSPGKSGSFFYFSRDYKYIIKTIHHAEHKLLRKMLRDYYNHVRDNPNTLISQFYGLHRVKIPYGRKIHFVVMNNLFPPHRDIHQTFDLKGSTIGRDFKEENLVSNPRATMKDLNWLRRDNHLEFDEDTRRKFVEQLQRDVKLLQRLQIMDYSLLVGIHDLEKGNEENVRETTLRVFQPGGENNDEPTMLMRTPSRLENARKARELRQTLKKEKPIPMGQVLSKMPDEMKADDQRQNRIFYSDGGGIRATHENGTAGELIYYLGVIDCLTHYGLVKRLEHFWKGLSNNSSQISPIPPQAYGDRFINFISGITITEEAAERTTIDGGAPEVDAHNNLHHHHIPPPTSLLPVGPTHSIEDQPGSTKAVDKTMEKAQKSTDRQTSEKGRRRSEEEDVPDRTLRTQTEEGRNSTTLPVVEEIGEGSSDVSGRRDTEHTVALSEKRTGELEEPSTNSTMELDNDSGTGSLQIQEKPSRLSGPPRLESGLIPTLTPFYEGGNMFDPEKAAAGDHYGIGRAL